MAQDSIFWTTNGSGDGADEYTQDDVTGWLLRSFGDGVLYGYGNALKPTVSGANIVIGTGAANIYGTPYVNDADVALAIPTVTLGLTGMSVVLQKSWINQEVRLVLKSSADGDNNVPAPVNNPGTTYEIILAGLLVSPPTTVSINLDVRTFAVMNTANRTRGLVIDRQGGIATDWTTGGTTNYTSTRTMQLFGATASGSTTTVSFVRNFAYKPLILLNNISYSGMSPYPTSITVSGFVLNSSGSGANAWMAVGEEAL